MHVTCLLICLLIVSPAIKHTIKTIIPKKTFSNIVFNSMSFGVNHGGQSTSVPFSAVAGFVRVLKDGTHHVTQPSDKFVTWDPNKEVVNPYAAYGPYDPYRIQEMKEAQAAASSKLVADFKREAAAARHTAAQKAFEEEMKKRAAAHAEKIKKMLAPGQRKLGFGRAKKDISVPVEAAADGIEAEDESTQLKDKHDG